MDSSHAQAIQRARAPHPRPASRSSTSTTHTRMASQSANSSTSQLPSSPQLSNAHPAHRFYQSASGNPAGSPRITPRHTPQLSREGSIESTRQLAVSSFLQEKLQRERRAESEKLGQAPVLSRLNTDLSASVELGRVTQHSPMRSTHSSSPRPRSSAGTEPARKPGLGVKEMEQVISTLHKQNFDLKLELFHRREKQSTMETQIESLETDKRQVQEINDTLMEELEKRDKAVEEAVAMIVMLEAKVDQLVTERAMVHQIEQQGLFNQQQLEKFLRLNMQSPPPEIINKQDDAKAINRMPSFLSERSENTENLRNVYLGVKGSALSLQRVTEGTPEPDNGLASPTLSVLSESSFASVYGKKSQDQVYPPPVDKPLSLDGVDGHLRSMNGSDDYNDMSRGRAPVLPVRAATANCFLRGNHTSGPFQPMSGVVRRESPLQQIERLDRRPQGALQEGFRPVADQGRERRGSQPAASAGRPLTKEEKREALRKVMTDAPGGVRLNDQNFPPTPDTISTSTLHRMRSSNDSLAPHQEAKVEHVSAAYKNLEDQHAGASLHDQPRLMPSPAKTREVRNSQIYGNTIRRPRSASESTISHRQEQGWDSDDESVHSLESSLDIWMRESTKPSKGGGHISPDLFGFPTSASNGGWSTNSMFGPNSVRPGARGIGPDADYMHDLFSLRQSLFAAQGGPPPPDRRSSLHAHTGSASNSIRVVEDSSRPGTNQNSPDLRNRQGHFRRQSDNVQSRADMRTPVQQQFAAPPPQPSSEQKKNHYPPITGQQAPRNTLNRLFRRSLVVAGGSNKAPDNTPPSTTEATFADAAKNNPTQNQGQGQGQDVGVPSWANRNIAVEEDERTGATPPPIMLNPRQMRRNTAGAETLPEFIPASVSAPGHLTDILAIDQQTPNTPKPAQTNVPAAPAPSSTGMRRKWLPGFAKAGSGLKNRAG